MGRHFRSVPTMKHTEGSTSWVETPVPALGKLKCELIVDCNPLPTSGTPGCPVLGGYMSNSDFQTLRTGRYVIERGLQEKDPRKEGRSGHMGILINVCFH